MTTMRVPGLRRAYRAPLVIFPVALAFVAARALWGMDLRELFVSPFTAAAITAVGYPLAAGALWLIDRFAPGLTEAKLPVLLLLGVAIAEIAFWAVVSPLWERNVPHGFSALLVGMCGLATALVLALKRPRS